MRLSRHLFAAAALLAASLGPMSAWAETITWTDWTAVDAAGGTASGTLDVNGTPVTITYSGPAYAFGQDGVSGNLTDYFTPNTPYLSSLVENSPPAAEMLALNLGGTVTISFSSAIEDFFIALVSWNSNTVDFNTPIEIVSFGAGFWGNGTPVLNAEGDGFVGQGEVHGVIRVPGEFTSLTFTHTSENWHGLTFGVLGLSDDPDPDPDPVPEPATLLLLGLGLIGLGWVRARRRS